MTGSPTTELRERVARKIAEAFTGCDPDTIIHPEFPAAPRIKGGFTCIHQHGAPLHYFFLDAADAAIAEVKGVQLPGQYGRAFRVNDIVEQLRNALAGAVSLHPAVNVRVIAVATLEEAITEIEHLRQTTGKAVERLHIATGL